MRLTSIVDIGGAGRNGEVVFEGTIDELLKSDKSITGQYLSAENSFRCPKSGAKGSGKSITVIQRAGKQLNSLKNSGLTIPLGTLTCDRCFGSRSVRASPRSSMIILYKKLAAELNGARPVQERMNQIEHEISATRSSTLTSRRHRTYAAFQSGDWRLTGVFNDIRDLFAKTATADANARLAQAVFPSMSRAAAEACSGDTSIEMHCRTFTFPAMCKACHYNKRTLSKGYYKTSGCWI